MHCVNTVQVYSPGVNPKFLEGGKMSCHLDSLAIGDCIEAKGPMGHVTYLGCGRSVFNPTPNGSRCDDMRQCLPSAQALVGRLTCCRSNDACPPLKWLA